jgi:hypothetical protein
MPRRAPSGRNDAPSRGSTSSTSDQEYRGPGLSRTVSKSAMACWTSDRNEGPRPCTASTSRGRLSMTSRTASPNRARQRGPRPTCVPGRTHAIPPSMASRTRVPCRAKHAPERTRTPPRGPFRWPRCPASHGRWCAASHVPTRPISRHHLVRRRSGTRVPRGGWRDPPRKPDRCGSSREARRRSRLTGGTPPPPCDPSPADRAIRRAPSGPASPLGSIRQVLGAMCEMFGQVGAVRILESGAAVEGEGCPSWTR